MQGQRISRNHYCEYLLLLLPRPPLLPFTCLACLSAFHFRNGKIIQKLTYSKTTVEIDRQRVRLCAEVA